MITCETQRCSERLRLPTATRCWRPARQRLRQCYCGCRRAASENMVMHRSLSQVGIEKPQHLIRSGIRGVCHRRWEETAAAQPSGSDVQAGTGYSSA